MYIKKYRLRQEILGDDIYGAQEAVLSPKQDSLKVLQDLEISKILEQRKIETAYQETLDALPPFIKKFNTDYSGVTLDVGEEKTIKKNLAHDFNTRLLAIRYYHNLLSQSNTIL